VLIHALGEADGDTEPADGGVTHAFTVIGVQLNMTLDTKRAIWCFEYPGFQTQEVDALM
tara:strand:+ start:457 stop:633 length:177 start_codon:yes stop_codon:yes gene_type:complete